MKKRLVSLLLVLALLCTFLPSVVIPTYAEPPAESASSGYSEQADQGEPTDAVDPVSHPADPAAENEPLLPISQELTSDRLERSKTEPASMSLQERLAMEPKGGSALPASDPYEGPCASVRDVSLNDVTVYTTAEDAAAFLREKMVAREPTAVFAFTGTEAPAVGDIYTLAIRHTGNPKEGDYLRCCIAYYNASCSPAEGQENTWIYQYETAYGTTAEQEAQVDAAVANALTKIRRNCIDNTILDIFLLTDAIPYDTYNYTNNMSEMYKQTAYGALVRGTAVCEGKAAAFYRLALECGVTDCRMAYGHIANIYTWGHVWNLLRRTEEEDYYFTDPTWSLYMTVDDPNFDMRNGDPDWNNGRFYEEDFNTRYPIATQPYSLQVDYTFTEETGELVIRSELPDIYVRSAYISNNEIGEDRVVRCWPEAVKENTKSITFDRSIEDLGARCFTHFEALETVELPQTVKVIGKEAFYACENLESAPLPEGLQRICDSAFEGDICYHGFELPSNLQELGRAAFAATGIEQVTIPAQVTVIEEAAFQDCHNLNSLTLHDNIRRIRTEAFQRCDLLSEVTIPESCVELGSRCFAECALTEVRIPQSVKELGESVFGGCGSLRAVQLPEGMTKIPKGMFCGCMSLKSIEVPETVRIIDEDAFLESGMVEFCVSPNVQFISPRAFGGGSICFQRIDVDPDNPYYSSEQGVLFDKDKTTLILYPNRKNDLAYEIPSSVTEIGDYAFCYHTALEYDSDVFQVAFPEGLERIGDYAFYQSDLSNEHLVIPDSVRTIGDYAFSCRVKSIALGASTVLLGEGAFAYSLVQSIVLNDKIKTIPVRFCSGSPVESITIPEGVTTIGQCAFDSCSALEEIHLPVTLALVDQSAFSNCTALSKVYYSGNEGLWGYITVKEYNDCLENAELICVQSTEEIRVSLDPGEGAPIQEITVAYGSEYGELPAPEREGHTFFGWFTKETGGIPITAQTAVINAADHTLYAHWEDTVIGTWTVGSITFTLHTNGELDCYGIGEIPSMGSQETCPWYDLRSEIKSIEIGDGITSIGDAAFFNHVNAETIRLPDTLIRIGKRAFFGAAITELIVPEGCVEIDVGAFQACHELQSVIFPQSLQVIGEAAFGMEPNTTLGTACSKIQSITIQGSTRIDRYAFRLCNGLESVHILNKNARVGPYAFTACTNLHEIELAEGITHLGEGAFSGCSAVESLTLPDSLVYIERDAFLGMTGLTELHLGKKLSVLDGQLFRGCTALEEVTIPEGCHSIGDFTFFGCTSLKTVRLPNTLEYVGEGAFAECDQLTTVCWDGLREEWDRVEIDYANDPLRSAEVVCSADLEPHTVTFDPCGGTVSETAEQIVYRSPYGQLPVPEREGYRFAGWSTEPEGGQIVEASTPVRRAYDHTLYAGWSAQIAGGAVCDGLSWSLYEDGCLEISGSGVIPYLDPAPWEAYLLQIASLELGEGVTGIEEQVFASCEDLWLLKLSGSVQEIGASAFRGCPLRSVVIPDGVERIGAFCFADCSVLKTVSVADSVTYIGDHAFEACGNLYEIRLPAGLERIGDYLFDNCKELRQVGWPTELREIGAYSFRWCGREAIAENNLGQFPDKLESIGEEAYYESAVRHVSLPSAFRTAGTKAFYLCRFLEEVDLAEGIETIGESMFAECWELKTAHLPSTVKRIERFAFLSTAITEADFPAGLEYLGRAAYENCHYLTEIILPDSLTEIEGSAWYGSQFSGCNAVRTAVLPRGMTEIPYGFFSGCDSLESIQLNPGTTSIGGYAFSGCTSLTELLLPDTVCEIGQGAFSGCTGLESVTIPASLSGIPHRVFAGCTGLKSITIPATIRGIDVGAFVDCTGIETIRFEGHAPTFFTMWNGQWNNFGNVTATVWYPGEDATWTDEVRQDYGGTLTWVPVEGQDGHTRTMAHESEPTCTEDGYTGDLICVMCEQILTQGEALPALGHDFVNGVCSRCGLLIADFAFSDVPARAYYRDAVYWALENQITSGTSPTSFSPNRTCTRAQIVTFLWRAKGCPEPQNTTNPFIDVESTKYYYKAVLWAVENGITNGTSSTTFSPDGACTRAQSVTFLWRAEGSPAVEQTDCPFTDVGNNAWYRDAVIWAVENGITNGVSSRAFAPGETCTRAQVVTFLYRMQMGSSS